jgi:hypothetical protein
MPSPSMPPVPPASPVPPGGAVPGLAAPISRFAPRVSSADGSAAVPDMPASAASASISPR